jgi:hypothetical protein
MNMSNLRSQHQSQLDALLAVPDPGREFDFGTYSGAQSNTQYFIDQRAPIVDQQLTSRGY